jgi:retron-type reverse transcriptase
MQVIQINLNHCEVAQDLLWQQMAVSSCDVALISEPYKSPSLGGLWVTDKSGSVAINTCRKYPIQEVVSKDHEGFVIVKIHGVYICSCYAPPRWSILEFESMLDLITNATANKKPLVIGGDFNAWAVEWGSRITNPRGQSLLEAFARLDICIGNQGSQPTFCKNGNESFIDITLCSPQLMNNLNWRVTDDYTASDHFMIRYSIDLKPPKVFNNRSKEISWNPKKLNKSLLYVAFELSTRNRGVLSPNELTKILQNACDISMPRKKTPKSLRKPAYWWNDEISECRKKCHKARRQAQRARSETIRSAYFSAYKERRSELRTAIKESKKEKFREMCNEMDNDPWGMGYKTVMAKLKCFSYAKETCPHKLKAIVDELFPTHEDTWWSKQREHRDHIEHETERKITNDEIIQIAKRLKRNKASGPDGIPNEVLKFLIPKFPSTFIDTYQSCLNSCTFPDIWKKQKLVLIPKPAKAGEEQGYRPICLLDNPGKVLESLMLNRIRPYTENETGLSNMQFGFRRGKSTLDAISTLTRKVDQAISNHTKSNRYCTITTIDVKNAFNSARWEVILSSLSKINTPEYLKCLIKSYLKKRVLTYDTQIGQVTREVNAGVPQGSILGPILWNIMYNDILNINLPDNVEIIGFADDIVLCSIGNTVDIVKDLTELAVTITKQWLDTNGLKMASHKTEIVLATNKRIPITVEIKVDNCSVTSKRQLKYLDVMIDDRLNYSRHVEYACEKASKVNTAIARRMPNTFGPRSSKRKLLANVTTSILRYGCAFWVEALEKSRNLEIMNRVHRLAVLRVASAYRTVSYDAACVVTGLIPIKMLLMEDKRCWLEKQVNGDPKRAQHREHSISLWQEHWDNSTKGRWTHKVIPQVKPWLERPHGEVDYFITQFLTGHGGFKTYLHKIRKTDSPLCDTCKTLEETPEHVLFVCSRFQNERHNTFIANRHISAVSLTEYMCESKEIWERVAKYMKYTLTTLEVERQEVQ